MQVNETVAEGLKRELRVTIPASELGERLDGRLAELKDRVRIKGFRPGKVPVAHLKRVYGKAAMAEIVEGLINETSQKALVDRGERAAMVPKIAMTEDEAEANRILEGGADLTFTVAYEVLPAFDLADFKGLTVERPVAEIADEEVEARLTQLGESAREYNVVDREARNGDRVGFSYLGKIDGEPFEGGTEEDAKLVLGSGQFIPGFEDGLLGLKAGDEKVVEVTFPDAYAARHLAGKAATFDVVVKEIGEPGELKLDDAFATRLGIESMEKLRDAVRRQIESEFGFATRQKVKRQVLDQLDERHIFDLPGNLVDQEFANIWREVTHDIQAHGRSFEAEGTTEEEAKAEYRKIAERRVRLGLVLSRIGEQAEVAVTDEELQRALYDQARRYPGQERQVFEYYQKTPDALQTLRAPIYEEKVIDYILELATVTEKSVSKEELLAEDDSEDGVSHAHHDHGHDHDHDHDHGRG